LKAAQQFMGFGSGLGVDFLDRKAGMHEHPRAEGCLGDQRQVDGQAAALQIHGAFGTLDGDEFSWYGDAHARAPRKCNSRWRWAAPVGAIFE
jgi:hypothetical protein